MKWRIVEVPEEEALPTDLTDSELLGVSILLTHNGLPELGDNSVYWRARQKIQPQVQVVLAR